MANEHEPLGLESIDDFEASLVPADDAPLPMPEDSLVPDHTPLAMPGDEVSSTDPRHGWEGKRLGPFRLMRVLGSGAMGVVFQAEDVNLHRLVALKVLRRQVKGPADQRRVERFLREARSAAAMDHPSIGRVYQIDQHDGWWFIAMEYLEGGGLDDLLAKAGTLSPTQAAVVLADAARGLAEAHRAGLIHRDIKPANLLLNRQGRCKLVDFGLVHYDGEPDPFARSDPEVLGTPCYMAPEIILGRGTVAASDVYSLGVSLYLLLTGDTPFRGETIDEIFVAHAEQPVPDVRTVRPDCPQSLASLSMRMLAKDPGDRPTAEEVAAVLQTEVSVATATGTARYEDGSDAGSGSGSGSGFHANAGRGRDGGRTFEGDAGGVMTTPVPDVSGRPARERGSRRAARLRVVIGAAVVAVLAVIGGVAVLWPMLAGSDADDAVFDRPFVNTAGMRMVPIEPGTFEMGSPIAEPGRHSDERRVEVRLTRPILMSATEVTQAQWAEVMGDDYTPPAGVHPSERNGLRFLGDTLPAYVSWREAAEFCRRLSAREGRLYRLPTEAEWEYACRAGSSTAFCEGDELTPARANVDSPVPGARPAGRPMPVASFPPNAWGLYDMHGNVMEWCADVYGPYDLGPLTDPGLNDAAIEQADGTRRVLRGGSWDAYPALARSANRWANYEGLRTDAIGFRVVLEPSAEALSGMAASSERAADDGETAGEGQASSDARTPEAGLAGGFDAVAVDPELEAYEPEILVDRRLRFVGSDTMDGLIGLWQRAFVGWHAGAEFRHEGRGSGTAVPALAEGIAHMGAMSRPMHAHEAREFQAEFGYRPTQVRVASDAIAIFVHRSNPIAERGLTLAELDAVFSTRRERGHADAVRTWGDLGLNGAWASRPIRVYGRNPASGTRDAFRARVLQGGSFAPSMRAMIGNAGVIEAVAGDPAAIGFGSAGAGQGGSVTVPIRDAAGSESVALSAETVRSGAYPLGRELTLTVALPPRGSLPETQREFLRFVFSREGQELVSRAGFIPLDAASARAERRRLGLDD